MTWQPLDIPSSQRFADFIAAFRSRNLPRPRWTHHAHLAVALWYLDEMPPREALDRVRRDIRAYNESVGVANTDSGGYHETLTQFFLRAVLAHRRADGGAPLVDSLHDLLASPMAQSDWPLRFYTKDRLFSVAARRDWLEPDLLGGQGPWSGEESAAFAIDEEHA